MSDLASVDEAWNAVMCDVLSVAKTGLAKMPGAGSFKFRGVDAVVDAVGPALRAHGVTVLPKRILKTESVEYESKGGARMVNKQVTVKWEVRGPAGDSFTGQSVGEAADSGDKAMSKAQSVAYRVFLLQALCIPSGDRDPDYDVHERASGQAREGRIGPSDEAVAAANEARGALLVTLEPFGWTGPKLCERFSKDYDQDLLAITDLKLIDAFGATLLAEHERARGVDVPQQSFDEVPAEPITEPQLRKLNTLLSKQSIVGHDARVQWCSESLGVEVGSTKNLTQVEAQTLIDKLDKLTQYPTKGN